MRRARKSKTVTLALSGFALLAGLLADAQAQAPPTQERPSPRQLEEPTYLPQQQDESFKLPPVQDEADKPAAAVAPGVEVKAVTFEGNQAIPTAELERIAAPFLGRMLTRIEVEQLREAVSRHYLARGYVNSGAVVPEDFYHDGTLRLRVIEGRIDELQLSGMGRLREGYIHTRLLRAGETLNVNTLQERFRLLLGDPLFAKINARLAPGRALGLARLELDITRARSWDLSLTANNYRSPSVGAEALGVGGQVRNLTGWGDALDASAQGGNADNQRYGIGWSVPLGARNVARLRYDNGKSSVLEEPLEALDVKSELTGYEAGLEHVFVETTRRRFSAGASFVHRENSTQLLGEAFSFVPGEASGTSKIDAWRFEQEFLQRWEQQAFSLRSTFNFGRTNTVSTAQTESIVPPKHYFFWLGQTQFTRRVLAQGGDLSLRVNAQLARDRLVPLERFALGGVASVRGYRENQAVRDQGFNVTLEFRYPLFERAAKRQRLTLIPFIDYGETWNKGEAHEELTSIGLGVAYQFKGFGMDLHYGKRLIEPEVETQGDLQDDGLHFQLRYAF